MDADAGVALPIKERPRAQGKRLAVAELQTQLYIAHESGYLSAAFFLASSPPPFAQV
jgi:hypothetical protein